MARTGRRSAAPDRHSADNDRTGSQAREANAEGDRPGTSRPITQRDSGQQAGEDDEAGRQVERRVQAVAERRVGGTLDLGDEPAFA